MLPFTVQTVQKYGEIVGDTLKSGIGEFQAKFFIRRISLCH